ncbi:diguanylate cyclase [Chelatococcus sambhunathii]|uniref:Diguanylate cyclase n=1 Tax=Chelatococcus sambhunathii TaxID=363953 RepID=A0ABU1DHJ8_9HYPH|nr:diguanylate cyclase [Chelatococcus sambhunathii]MDR4307513.1 diguanylate cyclase [Chelatococcus sambhunathii]
MSDPLASSPGCAGATLRSDPQVERLVACVEVAFADPALSADKARRIARLAEEAARLIRRRRDEAERGALLAELGRRQAEIARLRRLLGQSRADVERSLAAAGAGLWECRLQDERLDWSAGVYDLFGLPKGARLRRGDMLDSYLPGSLALLEKVRSEALRRGGGFRLEAEIETRHGHRRWIRVSGVVERAANAPIRLYGLKQDVTEERGALEDAWRLSEIDALTGLANRRRFEKELDSLSTAPGAALLLVDLDGFKQINDSLGHLTGDDCLKEAAARLTAACRGAFLVARLGGDEFAVLFAPGLTRADVERRGRDAAEALRFPVGRGDFMLELAASAGLALASTAGARDWIARADLALYAAKGAGRGVFRSFEPTMSRSRMAAAASIVLSEARLAG